MTRKEFDRITPEQAGIPCCAIEQLLDAFELGHGEPHGLMIMRYGKICAEGWWAPYAPGICHAGQSLTKTYAATAIGIAVTEGRLRLEDRLVDILPEYVPRHPSEGLKSIKLRDILCMGCGMDDIPEASNHWMEDFFKTPVVSKPGTTFVYNSMASALLGHIIQKLYGQSLHEFLTPRLFDKIGIDATNIKWLMLPDGIEAGGGGIFSTTEDNLRLMKLYADGGLWDGERILSEEYVSQASTIQNNSESESNINPEAPDNFLGYGFQLWMCRPRHAYRADGAMGQFAIVLPDQDLIIALHESTIAAKGAQYSLDCLWDILLPQIQDAPLPENHEAFCHLKKRLQSLSLENPLFSPFNGLSDVLSGRLYKIAEGKFTLHSSFLNYITNHEMSDGITIFSLSFRSGFCLFAIFENGSFEKLHVATDGTRILNTLTSGGTPATKVLMSGSWIKPNCFRILARWVETCTEKEIIFSFDQEQVDIVAVNRAGVFFPFENEETKMIATAVEMREE